MRTLGFILLAVVAFAGSYAVLNGPGPGVTLRNFCRIEVGMTEEEVADLMGGPPHRDGRVYYGCTLVGYPGEHSRVWLMKDDREIWVKVKDGRVVAKSVQPGVSFPRRETESAELLFAAWGFERRPSRTR